ncbi:MAG: protein kinase [Deltaproteobacteria bacterium]|nr:protein kinase [Deltaproteobacteria bacterium]
MKKAPENSLQIGTILNDKWVILEFVGKGGMGEVYRAHQLNLKRDVAIKVISREWLESLDNDEEELLSGLQRFRNEMQTMAQVPHSNILSIFDYGSFSAQGSRREVPLEYIAMEYLPGGTLRSTMSDEGFYPEERLVREWLRDYFLPVLDGLEALHDAGIVHRDIKPENILLDRNTPKIADFGLAHSHTLQPLTQSVDMKGTPAYMPPEQFMDFRRTDERVDIYALGKILHEAVDGRVRANTIPFKQARLKNTNSLFFEKLNGVIQNATAEEKQSRTGSVKELRNALMEVLGSAMNEESGRVASGSQVLTIFPEVFSAHRKWFYGISIATVAAIIIGLVWFLGIPEKPLQVSSHLKSLSPGTAKIDPSIAANPAATQQPSPVSMPRTLTGEDGASLHLVPGGTLNITPNSGYGDEKSVTVEPFYMDETLVTNHQYVDFLNQVISEIGVEENVVKSKGKIWLFLGAALEGYEPITYRGGRFHINKPAYASNPVVRVTAYGAFAYARFYGRRLPTAVEWAFALLKGEKLKNSQTKPAGQAREENRNWESKNNMMEMMARGRYGAEASPAKRVETPHIPAPVINSKPNDLGIRGLNENISEWGSMPGKAGENAKKGKSEYVILGGLEASPRQGSLLPAPLHRKPWEAFEEVSFRTVLSITAPNNGESGSS